jgi:hypothetical protein
VLNRLLDRLSYANVVATLALFLALGGSSYAVLNVGSENVANNSLRSQDIRNGTIRSRDIRDRTLRARDLRQDSLGSGVIKESTLGLVPRAVEAERLGGVTSQELQVKCPADTVAKAGVCVERTARAPDGFLGAADRCNQAGRGLPTMPQLDQVARSSGPLPQAEWTGSVYRNQGNGPTPVEQLEAVVLSGFGDVSYDRVYLAVQHAFRCVALPSN